MIAIVSESETVRLRIKKIFCNHEGFCSFCRKYLCLFLLTNILKTERTINKGNKKLFLIIFLRAKNVQFAILFFLIEFFI